MALFDWSDPQDSASIELQIALQSRPSVHWAEINQDDQGNFVEILLQKQFDVVPKSVVDVTHHHGHRIADVSERDSEGTLRVVVRP